MDKKNLIPIFFISFLILLLTFDIRSDCYDIDPLLQDDAKVLAQKFENLEKKFNKLKNTEKKLEKIEEFKSWGVKKEIEKIEKNVEKELNNVKKLLPYLADPSKYQEENCSQFCLNEENSCNNKFSKLVENSQKKYRKLAKDVSEIERKINIFQSAIRNKEKLKIIFERLIIDIDQKIAFMERVINEYKAKYPFNAKEIEKRGRFYIEKLQKEKELIKKYLTEGNFYKLMEYCYSNSQIVLEECIQKKAKQKADKFISQNKNKGETIDCEAYKNNLDKSCYMKVATIFKEFIETFKELDKEFFVILLDKKAVYKAKFSVYSWNDNYDYPVEHSITGEYQISEDLYNLLVQFIQTYGWDVWVCKYHGYLDCRISDRELYEIAKDMFNKAYAMTYDTTFELYVEDLYKAFYHLYLYKGDLQNIQPNPRWVEVDEETYRLFNEKNKIVMVKPKGYFGDQMFIKPADIYKSLKGNPAYGYYDNGVWHWLPYYIFLSRYLDDLYYSRQREIPPYMKDKILDNYYNRKKILREYAKKYGLCADPECKERKKADEKGKGYLGSYRGGLRTIGDRYRGRGYGGLGK